MVNKFIICSQALQALRDLQSACNVHYISTGNNGLNYMK
jgi:hypothetical protein